MSLESKAKLACKLIQNGDAGNALPLVDELVHANYETAHFIKGMLFLKGGRGLDVDLARATACFRQNVLVSPDAVSCLYLARALMRQEEPIRNEALRWLKHAAEAENPPETDLGFAAYYESAVERDYAAAKKYYAKAATRGRFAGFVGLARVQRLQGQSILGALTIATLWLASPLVYLIFGKRSRNPF